MASQIDRLFFAIRPDAQTALRIEGLTQALRKQHRLKGRSLGPERFHVTLHLIGDFAGGVPPRVIEAALHAAQPVAGAASPFHASFDHVASFRRKRRNMPVVLLGADEAEGVTRLQQSLYAALVEAGLASGPASPVFTPHLCLFYDDLPLAPQPIDPLIWTVSELLLVRSLVGQSRHEVLARLALRG
ncbi:MAG TPA: 2'-5' RNA ligase family protein [Variovorax sp.]|nr:2'-5' RNA ligase family protein [Variovorax sp.]